MQDKQSRYSSQRNWDDSRSERGGFYQQSYPSNGRGYSSYNQQSYPSSGRGYSSYYQQSYPSNGRGYSSYNQQSYPSDGRGYSSYNQRPYRTNSRDYSYYNEDDTAISRKLSNILRHTAEKLELKMDLNGYVFVKDILKLKNFTHVTTDDIMRIVKENDKQRFSLKTDEETQDLKVRANQGHSLKFQSLDLGLTPIDDATKYSNVLHGTYYTNWNSIKRQGLKRMSRVHIHFAPGLPGENKVISGMRSTCEILIYIDLEKAINDGLKFFLSDNNVILSSGDKDGIIAPKYFSKVIDYRLGKPFDIEESSVRKLPVGMVDDDSSRKISATVMKYKNQNDKGKSKKSLYMAESSQRKLPVGMVEDDSCKNQNNKGKSKKSPLNKQNPKKEDSVQSEKDEREEDIVMNEDDQDSTSKKKKPKQAEKKNKAEKNSPVNKQNPKKEDSVQSEKDEREEDIVMNEDDQDSTSKKKKSKQAEKKNKAEKNSPENKQNPEEETSVQSEKDEREDDIVTNEDDQVPTNKKKKPKQSEKKHKAEKNSPENKQNPKEESSVQSEKDEREDDIVMKEDDQDSTSKKKKPKQSEKKNKAEKNSSENKQNPKEESSVQSEKDEREDDIVMKEDDQDSTSKKKEPKQSEKKHKAEKNSTDVILIEGTEDENLNQLKDAKVLGVHILEMESKIIYILISVPETVFVFDPEVTNKVLKMLLENDKCEKVVFDSRTITEISQQLNITPDKRSIVNLSVMYYIRKKRAFNCLNEMVGEVIGKIDIPPSNPTFEKIAEKLEKKDKSMRKTIFLVSKLLALFEQEKPFLDEGVRNEISTAYNAKLDQAKKKKLDKAKP